MATLTIRNVDPKLKAKLRVRAARNARSMEEELRVILREAVVADSAPPVNLAVMIAKRFKRFGGVDLEIPPREPIREPPKFR
jgi:plasmid stability protein